MAWAAAIGGSSLLSGVGSFISGLFGSKSKRQEQERDLQTQIQLQELRNTGMLENTQLQAEEAWYYKQLQEQQNLRGVEQFRQFSTVHNYAPGFANTNPNPVIVPNAPVIPTQVLPQGRTKGTGF